MAGVYRLNIDQGTTVRRTLRWTVEGQPVDLTGAKARMEIKTTVGGDLLLRLDSDNGGLILGGVDGTIVINIVPEQTSTLTQRSGVYDIEVVDALGNVTRLLQGQVSISPEVTTGE